MSPAPETNPANPAPEPNEGRDAGGRFAKGNPGGPGNPFPRRVAAIRRAMLNCVTDEDIVAITKAVIEEAKSGNIAAAKLIFQYVLGKPGSMTDLEWTERLDMMPQDLPVQSESVASDTPKAKGPPAAAATAAAPTPAPKANGADAPSIGIALPTGSPREIDHWLDRKVSKAMAAMGKAPIANGV
jgi:hypothetical protein